MAKKDNKELLGFLKAYPQEVRSLILWLRDFIWELYPECNELIYDNYNALALGWSTTDRLGDTFCSVAAFREYAHFGFYRGTDLVDSEKLLIGNGNQYRYIIVRSQKEFPKASIKKLLKQAHTNSIANLEIKKAKKPETGKASKVVTPKGITIIKSISAKKRRP